jgi:predicted DNA-binding antitoxin AbrB/MazE fold protein
LSLLPELAHERLSMYHTTAIFANGVLTPSQPLQLPSPAKVRLTIELLDENDAKRQGHEVLAALEELWRHSSIDSQGDRLTRDELHERR